MDSRAKRHCRASHTGINESFAAAIIHPQLYNFNYSALIIQRRVLVVLLNCAFLPVYYGRKFMTHFEPRLHI